MINKPKNGGARKGSGRKALDGATGLKRVTVSLDAETIEKARHIGNSCVSAGIRLALRNLPELPTS